MAKFIKLNPYKTIQESIDTFFELQYGNIEALILRDDPTFGGKLREMSLSKLVKNAGGQAIGILNIHMLNRKYETANQKTNTREVRAGNESFRNVDASPEFFKTEFFDEDHRLTIRISFTQFPSDAMALSNVKYSATYNTFVGEAGAVENAIKTKEVISYLWEDPAIVLVTKDFFTLVDPILDTWVPTVDDVTGQTLFVA